MGRPPVLQVLLLASVVGACVRPVPTPYQTLQRYAQALDRDDPRAAYDLLDSPTRNRMTYAAFAVEWKRSALERGQQRQALAGALKDPPRQQAAVVLGDGARIGLMEEASGFRLVDTELRAVRARTPQEALHLLLAAAERRDYPAVLRLLTETQREQLEAELRERIAGLRGALKKNAPVEISGDRARYQYDPRFFVELQRDPHGWRVLDFN